MSGLFGTFTTLGSDASAQPSLLKELWDYFTEKYFTLDISQYENLDISIGGTGVINLSWAMVALCFGIVLAAILGVLVGNVKIPLTANGLSGTCFSLTTTGGCLITSLIFGHFAHFGPVNVTPKDSTLKIFKELGLTSTSARTLCVNILDDMVFDGYLIEPEFRKYRLADNSSILVERGRS